MTREERISKHLSFVQSRIEAIEEQILNYSPDQKGYKELVESYNKWQEKSDELEDKLEHLDDVDIELEKLNIERLKLERTEEIEQDKLNLAQEQLRLDREKFVYETEAHKKEELISNVFKTLEVGGKIALPLIGMGAAVKLAKISYINDLDMKLCNGNVRGAAKELLKMAISMKV